MKDFLIFCVDGERYALDIEYVEKIVEDRKCTKVSGLEDFIDGVISYENDLLKIVNIRKILSKKITTIENQKIIIYKDKKRRVGLKIDYVDKIEAIGADNFKPGNISFKDVDMLKMGKTCKIKDGKLVVMIDSIDISNI